MAETEIPQKIDDQPEHIYLNRHVRNKLCEACDVNPQAWKDLGTELMPDAVTELSTVSAQHHGSVVDCCSSLFQLWLQKQPNASWRQLIEALKKISLNRLATDIERKLIHSINPASQSIVPLRPIEGIPSVSEDDVSDLFKEPITITKAYTILIRQLANILNHCDLSTLKVALIHQAHTPDGVELEKSLEEKIEAAKTISDLLLALGRTESCNWLDTRLIEVLACGSESSTAVEVINAYQKFLFSKKLSDVLSRKREHMELKRDYVTAIRLKTKMDPAKITVGDFINYRWTIEDVILDLGKGVLNIEHVNEGCLEINYVMPVYYSFNAYKMVLHNRYKFYTIDLFHVEIGDHPLIHDPLLSDLETHSVKQILHAHHKVSLEMCHILLDNVPMDDIVQLFRAHKILIDDDVEVVSFAPSEHLRNKYLLECLWILKQSVWPVVCDILLNTKSMRHVGSQLMEVFKDKLPQMEHYKQTLASDKHIKTVNTLHGARTIKLGFVDDSTLFNKPQICYSRKISLLICPFQHVKGIKPSEVDKEFQYVSRHVLELLSHCHPKLLINCCENLLASELANHSPLYELLMLWFGHFDNPMANEHGIKLLPPYTVYKLRKLRTSSAILKMMSMFWSWSNHSILTSLAKFSEIAAALLEEFDSRLYVNSSIAISSSLAPAMIPHNNNSFTLLILKCNRKLKVTLQLVYDMQLMMIEKCEISQHALQLLAVQSSPLVLQWMISKYIVTVINVNVRKHQEYFATKGIIEILIHPNIKHCIDGDLKLLPIQEKADELYSAAITGNVAETKKLLQSGVYVDSTNNTGGWTPLYVATFRGDGRVVEVLIRAGADVNLADEWGWTPLYTASWSGHYKVVEVLITAGADVNLANKWGWTPLYIASWCGHYNIVKVLITAGADMNLADKDGQTPLYKASVEGYYKVVEVLLTAGADVNFVDKKEDTPLYIASWSGHHKVVEVLITAGADVNLANERGRTPLYMASWNGNYKVVKVLITAGADVNLADNGGWTPLYRASWCGHDKVVEVLLTAGADVNLANEFGRTPVDAAIRGCHHKVVDVLLKSAVNIIIDSKKKLEQFFESAKKQQVDIERKHLISPSTSHTYSSDYSQVIKKLELPTTSTVIEHSKEKPQSYESKQHLFDIKEKPHSQPTVIKHPEVAEKLFVSSEDAPKKQSVERLDTEKPLPP